MDFSNLLEKVEEYLPAKKIAVVEDAYKFAAEKHQGQMRLSGEPFLEHPLQTAFILAELQLDASSIAAALLHDIPEDCGLPVSEIEARFGPEIAKLVDGTTKLGKVSFAASPAVANGVVYHVNREQRENPNYGAPGMDREPRYVEGRIQSLDVVVGREDAEWLAFALAHGEIQVAVLPAVARDAVEAGRFPVSRGVTWSDWEEQFFVERVASDGGE